WRRREVEVGRVPRIETRKYAAKIQSTATDSHATSDASTANTFVALGTAAGTMSFELLTPECRSIGSSRLPPVRIHSHASVTESATTSSANTERLSIAVARADEELRQVPYRPDDAEHDAGRREPPARGQSRQRESAPADLLSGLERRREGDRE